MLKKPPVVSVIVPTYNRGNEISEAIRSALEQDHVGLEVLIIDDGSTDDTGAVVAAIADRRINYHRINHRGRSAARNYGISVARGEYIAFLDSDDIFLPQKISCQLRFMIENNAQISHTSYLRHDTRTGDKMLLDTSYLDGNVYPRIISHCPIATPTVMVRRSFLEQYQLRFSEKLDIGEDVCLWIDVAKKTQWYAIKEPLSEVRVGGGTVSCDYRLLAIGILNVALHVLGDDALQKDAQVEVARLLKGCSRSLDNNGDSWREIYALIKGRFRTKLKAILGK